VPPAPALAPAAPAEVPPAPAPGAPAEIPPEPALAPAAPAEAPPEPALAPPAPAELPPEPALAPLIPAWPAAAPAVPPAPARAPPAPPRAVLAPAAPPPVAAAPAELDAPPASPCGASSDEVAHATGSASRQLSKNGDELSRMVRDASTHCWRWNRFRSCRFRSQRRGEPPIGRALAVSLARRAQSRGTSTLCRSAPLIVSPQFDIGVLHSSDRESDCDC